MVHVMNTAYVIARMVIVDAAWPFAVIVIALAVATVALYVTASIRRNAERESARSHQRAMEERRLTVTSHRRED